MKATPDRLRLTATDVHMLLLIAGMRKQPDIARRFVRGIKLTDQAKEVMESLLRPNSGSKEVRECAKELRRSRR